MKKGRRRRKKRKRGRTRKALKRRRRRKGARRDRTQPLRPSAEERDDPASKYILKWTCLQSHRGSEPDPDFRPLTPASSPASPGARETASAGRSDAVARNQRLTRDCAAAAKRKCGNQARCTTHRFDPYGTFPPPSLVARARRPTSTSSPSTSKPSFLSSYMASPIVTAFQDPFAVLRLFTSHTPPHIATAWSRNWTQAVARRLLHHGGEGDLLSRVIFSANTMTSGPCIDASFDRAQDINFARGLLSICDARGVFSDCIAQEPAPLS